MPAPRQTRIMPAPIQDVPRDLLEDQDANDTDEREDDPAPEPFKPLPEPPREPKGLTGTNLGVLEPADPVPGMIAQPALVKTLPPLRREHASVIFPQLFPRPAGPHAPGVFVDPISGRPVMPQVRVGGQFSLLLLTIGDVYGIGQDRKEVVPVGLSEQEWGLQAGDIVRQRVEVVFDFEKQRDECLKACGKRGKLQDPLNRRDPLGNALDAAPVPSLTPHASGR